MTVIDDMQGLSDLGACAYALGMVFGREAKAATDQERMLRYFDLFQRCFHGYRVSVALKLRLSAAARRGATVAADGAEELRGRPDPTESDPTEREPIEREHPERERIDGDRDRETASLPLLLKTLNGVVAGAEALPGPQPAELPTLRELLARMGARSPTARPSAPLATPPRPTTGPAIGPAAGAKPAGVAVLARPPVAAPGARTRWLRGAGLASLAGPRDTLRPATGPPRSG
ncbi:hypothetical protein [Phenylobacterium sp.]|uniref:hypothetical protein n=1 Tax=Phenylobacterium sp. TaxID=1871053 RepID=UPI00301C0CD5